jgi:hypothetical protein
MEYHLEHVGGNLLVELHVRTTRKVKDMVAVHPQYIVDEDQNRKSIVLSCEEWAHIVEELEELDDIRAYDEAKAGPLEADSFEAVVKEIRGSLES